MYHHVFKIEEVRKIKSPTILCIEGPYHFIKGTYYVLYIVHEKQNIIKYYIFQILILF